MVNCTTPIASIAFPRFLELLEIDPSLFDANSQHEPPLSMSMRQWGEMDQAIAISDCLALGDREITAQLMLSRLLDGYVESHSYTIKEILHGSHEVQGKIALVRQIRAVLDREDVLLKRVEFSHSLANAVKHYNADHRDDVQDLIEDDAELAVLRRDALTALDKMRTSQFLQGDAGELVRPQYSTVIRRWWNIDHLLAAHTSIPEGVSLNMIKTPAAHDVFFCFVVRRGANLYVLDDAPEYSHPLQSGMSRSPGRRMADRMAKFWFPYDLSDVQISEDGKQAFVSSERGRSARGLEVAGKVNDFSQVLSSISDLPPHELLWTTMVFDLIMDRFWSHQPLPVLPLSYTSTQLKPDGQLLLEAAQGAGLPVVMGDLGTLAVPNLLIEQVALLHHSSEAEQMLGDMGDYGSLSWLENRYAAQVSEEGLNHISSGSDLARIGFDGQLAVIENPDMEVIDNDRFFGRENALLTINSMDQTKFGTAQEMRADRAFLARSNYARSLSAFAKKEYKDRRDEVQTWLCDAYSKRVDFLKTLAPAAHTDALRVVDWEDGVGSKYFEFKNGVGVSKVRDKHEDSECVISCSHSLGWIAEVDDRSTAFMPYLRQGSEPERCWKPLCQVTGQKASYYLAVKPSNAIELAWLLGVDRDDLPDVLRHHSALLPSSGNCILDRIDPMLWALHNPWHDLNLGVRMGLSKRGLAQLQKTHSAPVDLSHLNGFNLAMFKNQIPDRSVRPLRAGSNKGP